MILNLWILLVITVACTSTPKYTSCLQCPATRIIDLHQGPEDPRDTVAFDTASARCHTKYIYSPCLVSFTRNEPGNYYAVCGEPQQALCQEEP